MKFIHSTCRSIKKVMKKALREMQTLCALAVVRFGHRPPRLLSQTHRQDRLQYTAPQLQKKTDRRTETYFTQSYAQSC